jgi:hypothetical protein
MEYFGGQLYASRLALTLLTSNRASHPDKADCLSPKQHAQGCHASEWRGDRTPDKIGLVDVEWNGHCFSVFREDLLDACTVDDAVRVSFL